jgi:hypothetical protein
MSFLRRIECYLFSVAFIAFGWFNQGGGWNQNARFAEVRAIVDGGELSIDDYFCYVLRGSKMLRRYPVVNGDVTIGTKTTRLCWVGDKGDLTPVNGVEIPTPMDGRSIDDMGCSGDVSFALGHLHPNKPPGLSFVAVPAYFVLSHFERMMHRDPDGWWLMNVNAWLTSVFSVGLISAVGVVLAFRLALRLGGGRIWPAFWTAIAFGFGTIYFPFATLLFDHNVTATFLIAGFYCLFQRSGVRWAAAAGLVAGMAAITNYVAAVPVGMLGIYLLVTRWRDEGWRAAMRDGIGYGLGLLGPLLAICAYNRVCYGSPFALSNAFQNPGFIETGPVFLGMFAVPDPVVALILLVSPFRGVFYEMPVMAMGVYGLWKMRKTHRAEVWLFTAIALTFYLMNCSFFGWHAGFSCGPRYLIPATAFLSLPCVFGFMAWPRLTGALLAVSVGINFLFAATDAECPAGVGDLAMTRDRDIWWYSPLTEYAAPLFFEGRAWPLLNQLTKEWIGDEEARLVASGTPPEERQKTHAATEAQIHQAILDGKDEPFALGSYTGPVSVNPTGVCEGGYYSLFDPGSPQARWNSFNVGEFWFPASCWSVEPLLAIAALLGLWLAREAAQAGESKRVDGLAAVRQAMPGEEIAAE